MTSVDFFEMIVYELTMSRKLLTIIVVTVLLSVPVFGGLGYFIANQSGETGEDLVVAEDALEEQEEDELVYSDNGVSYAVPVGWRVRHFNDNEIQVAITSPDFVGNNIDPIYSYPQTGIAIYIMRSYTQEGGKTIKELMDTSKKLTSVREVSQITVGNLPAVHSYGKTVVELPSSYQAMDDYYEIINGDMLWQIGIVTAGSPEEADVTRGKYKAQLDQFLQSFRVE